MSRSRTIHKYIISYYSYIIGGNIPGQVNIESGPEQVERRFVGALGGVASDAVVTLSTLLRQIDCLLRHAPSL